MTPGAHQLSDTEIGKDANVLIMELNKGLQSTNLGDQCKAIAQFPNLLEKYPFPVVVNSVSLKIAQVFCDGSNYVRLCILRACSSCRSHLEKLTVCDDIVRKLMPFTASNDPVTRALTLRLFGTLSQSSREHIGVHHAVLKQIESHYGVESDAAIWSSHQLAPLSCAFAVNLCPILCRRLISLSTECEVKLKLLRLGRYMHHDVQIAEQMRECLVNMLSVYNTSEFVTNILDTLTSLASSASIHTCHQLNLLIDSLCKDDRTSVRLNALQNLGLLAYRAPHHWEKSHLTKLCSHYISADKSPAEREKILHVFYCLACSEQAVDILQTCSDNSESTVVFCIKNALLTFPATRLTVKAIQLACKLVLLTANPGSSDASVQHSLTTGTTEESSFPSGLLVCLMAAHFTVGPTKQENVDGSTNGHLPWFLAPEGISLAALKLTYTLMVQFFDSFPEYASALHKMGLFEHVRLNGGPRVGLLCEFLSTLRARLPSIMSPQSDEQIYHPASLLSRVSAQATHLLTSSTTSTSVHVSILPVCGLIFQLSEGTLLTAAEQQTLLAALARAVIDSEGVQENVCAAQLSPIPPRLPCWLAYQVARQANRYGQHDLAASIYEKLSPLTLSERTNYWLRGLWEFSRAEAQLLVLTRRLHADCPQPQNDIPGAQEATRPKPQPWVDDLIDGLRQASDIVHKTRSMFICVGGSDNRWFQAEYVGIRGNLYLCLAELCISANYFTHVSRGPGRYRSRCTDSANPTAVRALAVPTWVMRQLDLWCGLADRLRTLQSQCLDADQTTHGHLYAIIQLVGFFIDVLQSIRDVYGGADKLHYEQVPVSENLSKGDPFRTVLQELRQIAQSHMKFNPLQPTNFDWLSYLALQVARVASHWPRFFFQRLQTSTVRLVLLPKAGNNPEDVLTVSSEVGHMVQVMGVVQQRSRLPHGQVARRIHAVEVELTVTTASSETPGLHRRGVGDLVFSSIRSARLQRDYFHCEFCVRFPDPAQLSLNTAQRQANTIYRVSAVAILSDTFGTRWRLTHASGAPIETTLVRVESANNSSLSVPSTPTKPTDPADSRVHV